MTIVHQIVPIILAALIASAPCTVGAQTAGTIPDLPAVPTTKVLAISRVAPAWTPDAMRTVMPREIRETVQLYMDGKIDQWFVRKDQRGVVFVLNVSSVAEANRLLDDLPLGQARLMDFEVIPLGPFAPLGLLLTDPPTLTP